MLMEKVSEMVRKGVREVRHSWMVRNPMRNI